jgi:glycosyltransferase involved in cell wall biosynthesis
MKILQLTSDYIPNPLWGMGWHVKFLVDELKKRDKEVYVGTTCKSKGKYIITTPLQVEDKYLSKTSYKIFDDFDKFISWQGKLADIILEKKILFDIIHCHNWMSWQSAKKIKNSNPKAKIISTIHFLQKQYDLMEENPTKSFNRRIILQELEMLNGSDYIIFQTPSHFKFLKEHYPSFRNYSKVRIIPSGINSNEISFEKLEKIKRKNKFKDILFIGRIEKDKGILFLINSFRKLERKYPLIRLQIFGEGNYLKELKKRYSSKKIIFRGFVNRNVLERSLAKAHIFCLPSSSESFGNSVIESMHFGIVPIFSEGNTVPVLFKKDICGLKVPLEFTDKKIVPSEVILEKSLEKLILNKNLLEKLSRNAYKYSRYKYSIEKMGEKIMEIYNK